MYHTGRAPASIVAEQGLAQVNDQGAIAKLVADVLSASPAQLREYLSGKETLEQWFFGQVMRRTQGRGNPQVIRTALSEALHKQRRPQAFQTDKE